MSSNVCAFRIRSPHKIPFPLYGIAFVCSSRYTVVTHVDTTLSPAHSTMLHSFHLILTSWTLHTSVKSARRLPNAQDSPHAAALHFKNIKSAKVKDSAKENPAMGFTLHHS